jgi:hypothetical protein
MALAAIGGARRRQNSSQEADAKTSGTVIDRGTQMSGDRIVTQVFICKMSQPAQIATVLVISWSQLNNFIGAFILATNTLVITDYAIKKNAQRITRFVLLPVRRRRAMCN